MRPSEVLALTASDIHSVARSRRSLGSSSIAITVCPLPEAGEAGPLTRRTKNNSFEDTLPFDEPCDNRAGHGWVATLLCELKAESRPMAPLFDISLSTYERLFKEATVALGLGALRLTPHSLRHGGASEDAAAKLRSAAEIQKRGRWAAAASVRRYMKPGTLMRQWNIIPAQIIADQRSTLDGLPRLLRPQPWRLASVLPNTSIAKRRRLR